MRLLITDDEGPARTRIRSLLAQVEDLEIVGEAANGSEALHISENKHPDVVLLDIRMPGMNGMETARHLLTLENPPAVIFTTAYDQHALEAFETNAVDYLLKPVRRERLEQALKKVKRLKRDQIDNLQKSSLDSSARTQICTRTRGKLQLIPVQTIRYFFAEQKYVTVCHEQGEVLIEESLKSLEEEFCEQFTRVHRNALVALSALVGMEKTADGSFEAIVEGADKRLEISRRHVSTIRKLLKSNS